MFGQQLVNGVVSGSIYALFALGFTLMFGVLGVINLVYGVYFSAGAFIALYLTDWLKLSIGPALVVAALATGAGAVVVDGLLLTRLRRAKAPELASLMVTLGATLFIYSLANAAFGSDIRRFRPDVFGAEVLSFAGVRISEIQIAIVATVALVVVALMAIIRKTRLGIAIRAVSEDVEAAQLMGVNAAAATALVSFISASIGAVAGVLIGLNYNAIQPYMGESMMLKGFAVIVLGGVGDIGGALAAGLLIGMLETLTAGYLASSLKDAVGFVLLVLTLWTRPSGLFGHSMVKRA